MGPYPHKGSGLSDLLRSFPPFSFATCGLINDNTHPMTNQTPEPQSVYSPISSSAIFIVATVAPGSDCAEKVRG